MKIHGKLSDGELHTLFHFAIIAVCVHCVALHELSNNSEEGRFKAPEFLQNVPQSLRQGRFFPVRINFNLTGPSFFDRIANSLGSFKSKFNKRTTTTAAPETTTMKDRTGEGCIQEDGTERSSGEFFEVLCETWLCLDGEIIRPEYTYGTECPDDYELVDDLGCIKFFDDPSTWCDARRKCLEMGADLVSLDGNAVISDSTPFRTYFESMWVAQDVWVGLRRTDTNFFEWVLGGGQISFQSDIWGPNDPNGPGQVQCARSVDGSYNFALGDRLCDDPTTPDGGEFAYVCEVPGFG